MDTPSDPNTSTQTAQSATNQTVMNQTAADRMEIIKEIQDSDFIG